VRRLIDPSHAVFLKYILDQALQLEIRILNLLPVLAGSGWVFAPEFLSALNPLLDDVIKQLSLAPKVSPVSQRMVEYLRVLQILPPAELIPTTTGLETGGGRKPVS